MFRSKETSEVKVDDSTKKKSFCDSFDEYKHLTESYPLVLNKTQYLGEDFSNIGCRTMKDGTSTLEMNGWKRVPDKSGGYQHYMVTKEVVLPQDASIVFTKKEPFLFRLFKPSELQAPRLDISATNANFIQDKSEYHGTYRTLRCPGDF
jgi:hypothetical protein